MEDIISPESPIDLSDAKFHYSIMGPNQTYAPYDNIVSAIEALKLYIEKSKALKLSIDQRKDLLEAGEGDAVGLSKVIVEVVFKNIPVNKKTYIHNIRYPYHWRLQRDPDECKVALFVRTLPASNKAEKITFQRNPEAQIEQTHQYWKDIFNERLKKHYIPERIAKIITVKELATEYKTPQKLDKLAKSYDLFLSDYQLMSNKMNPLPRRLGRRFWVREKKAPVMVKLSDEPNLEERMVNALSTEQFYVCGLSATEKCQVGLINQSTKELASNLIEFLKKLYHTYGDNVRLLRIRTNWGIAIPLYADLYNVVPKVTSVMKSCKLKKIKCTDDFDFLGGDAKVSVHSDGTVNIIRPKKRKSSAVSPESHVKTLKRARISI